MCCAAGLAEPAAVIFVALVLPFELSTQMVEQALAGVAGIMTVIPPLAFLFERLSTRFRMPHISCHVSRVVFHPPSIGAVAACGYRAAQKQYDAIRQPMFTIPDDVVRKRLVKLILSKIATICTCGWCSGSRFTSCCLVPSSMLA